MDRAGWGVGVQRGVKKGELISRMVKPGLVVLGVELDSGGRQ